MEQSKAKAAKKKILLMGRSGSGKSSMRSIIFSNFVAKDVRRLGATIDVEHTQFKFLGNLILNLWDCGGQDAFTETYLTSQKAHVFSDVGVLIYVFDCESRHFKDHNSTADFATYSDTVSTLAQFSPNAHVFCLIHKLDLVSINYREPFLDDRIAVIERYSGHFSDTVKCYGTSIWEQSLYTAWGDIVQSLTPNLHQMDSYLRKLLEATNAEEVILFERATFLKVTSVATARAERNPYPDRFEKLSTIVKSFKHALQKYTGASSSSLQPRGGNDSQGLEGGSTGSRGVKSWASHPFGEFNISCAGFNLLLSRLTSNAYILVVTPPGETGLANMRLNVMSVRDELERLENPG